MSAVPTPVSSAALADVADGVEFRPAAFRRAILAWYDARGRSLPFRGATDPYAVLVSETMAQQTQIGRVGPAWTSFLARFPTFEALTAATPADVLREWRGLGYNRRALNLQRAARVVVEQHGGRLPLDIAELEGLPGIGPYTARAVAAIAFGRPVGAVDTNVRRVLGRVATGDIHGLPPGGLQQLADILVPAARPADWTHALMDVGATHCRSAVPRCDGCPAAPFCAYLRADTGARPSRSRRGAPASGAKPGRPGLTTVSPGGGARAASAAGHAPVGGFEASSRWLRGRIVERARGAAGDGWVSFREALGRHGVADVQAMLGVLAREGLLEMHPIDPAVARLPLSDGPTAIRLPRSDGPAASRP